MIVAARVAIIGVGHVGATAAFALMLRALFREIVLVDADAERAEAEAADLRDANALARPARIWAGDYADAAAAGIAVLTAGAATHGNEDRLAVAARSAEIVGECVDRLAEHGFAGILVVAANPVDVMSLVAFRKAGLPAARVLGTGTLLDTCRLQQIIGATLKVAPASVHGLVIGEHGNSKVAAFSTVNIGGVPLAAEGFAGIALDRPAVAAQVRNAGYRILTGKGYTSFGIATAIVRICEAVLRNERSVLPVSTLLTGEFELSDLYLSLPCIIGSGGVETVLTPAFTPAELAGLQASAAAIKAAIATIA
jgi:L-lactate dehydrogenase